MSDEIAPDNLSPWWPCPHCGGTAWKTVVYFERGEWQYAEHEMVWREYVPPRARPTGTVMSFTECASCGEITDLPTHYGWNLSAI